MAPGPPTSLPRGNPLGGAWGEPGPSWLAAPELLLRVQSARACPARGPMCSAAAARALPGGARGRRAAVTSGRLALRAAGGGEARAARPAACVLGPARGPPGSRRPAARPAGPSAGCPASTGHPGRPGPRAGGAGPVRTSDPEGAGEGALRTGTGSPPASATPGDALSPLPALAAAAAPLSACLPAPGVLEAGSLPTGQMWKASSGT